MKTLPCTCLLIALVFVASASASPWSFLSRQPAPGTIPRTPSAMDWLPDGRFPDFAPPQKPADGVEILQVTPQRLLPGVPQEVKVRIRYTLSAAPKGLVGLGFNVGSSTTFRLVDRQWVKAGQGEIEFITTIEPTRWPDGRPLKAYANLSFDANATRRTSLASHVLALKLQ